MTMSVHWITRDWSLRTSILGTINFLEDHTIANISDKLMDLRLEFGVYPRNSDGRTPQCLDVVRIDKLMYFQLEPQLDKLVLANDCGNDVFAGEERDQLWDWNHCACHCSNTTILKEPIIEECPAPLTTLARRCSKSRSAWNRFKKTQMKVQNREECNDDEREANFDGDEDFAIGGEGQPHLKKVLQLLRPMAIC